MTITQYIPQWFRTKLQKPASQKAKVLSKKDRQILPILPKCPPSRFQDDNSPPGYVILWRL